MKKALSVILAVILTACVCVPAFASSKKLNYVLLGDSIAFGSGIANPGDACYGKIVANTNGYNYRNYGVDGATTSALLRRIGEADVAQAIKNADIISISTGGNNFLLGNMFWIIVNTLFGGTKAIDDVVDGVYADLCQIIPAIKKLNPKATILLQTLYNPWKMAGISALYQKATDALNSCFRKYLKENPGAFEIAEVAAAFAASDKDLIAFDTIHPNAEGNKVIARVILKKLKTLGLGTKTEPVILEEPIDKISFNPGDYSRMAEYYLRMVLAFL